MKKTFLFGFLVLISGLIPVVFADPDPAESPKVAAPANPDPADSPKVATLKERVKLLEADLFTLKKEMEKGIAQESEAVKADLDRLATEISSARERMKTELASVRSSNVESMKKRRAVLEDALALFNRAISSLQSSATIAPAATAPATPEVAAPSANAEVTQAPSTATPPAAAVKPGAKTAPGQYQE